MLKCFLFLNLLAAIAIGSIGDGFGVYHVKAQTKPRVFNFSEKDDEKKIRLRKGDIVVVKLKAQFGTGYSWQVAVNNNKRFQLIRQSVEQTNKNGEIALETQTFRFKAKQTGNHTLELRYVRVWEKEVEPLKTFRLKLQISKS